MIRILSTLLLLVFGLRASSPAQKAGPPNPTETTPEIEQHTLPTPAQEGTASDDSSANNAGQSLPVPALVGGAQPSLAFSSEKETNYLRGGVSVGSSWDDNAFLLNTSPVSNYSYSVLPYIAIEQSRARLQWTLNYAAGFVNQLSSWSGVSHNLSFKSQYRLSPHVNLYVSEHFSIISNASDQLNSNQAAALGSIYRVVILPLSKQIASSTTAEMDYQFSRTNIIGGSGSFYDSRFRDAPASTPLLLDTQTQRGNAFFAHRLSAKNWVGTSYSFQHLTFGSGLNDVLVHSVLAFVTTHLQPNMTLSIFGGPEYSTTKGPFNVSGGGPTAGSIMAIHSQYQSYSGGASYNWNGQRTTVFVEFARRLYDGGGLLGAAQQQSVSAELRRKLTRNWTAGIGGYYGTNDAINTLPSALSSGVFTSVRGGGGTLTLDHQLRNNMFLKVGYSHALQQQSTANVAAMNVSRNLVTATVSYQFERPIGR